VAVERLSILAASSAGSRYSRECLRKPEHTAGGTIDRCYCSGNVGVRDIMSCSLESVLPRYSPSLRIRRPLELAHQSKAIRHSVAGTDVTAQPPRHQYGGRYVPIKLCRHRARQVHSAAYVRPPAVAFLTRATTAALVGSLRSAQAFRRAFNSGSSRKLMLNFAGLVTPSLGSVSVTPCAAGPSGAQPRKIEPVGIRLAVLSPFQGDRPEALVCR
jgi:hypothetical protein